MLKKDFIKAPTKSNFYLEPIYSRFTIIDEYRKLWRFKSDDIKIHSGTHEFFKKVTEIECVKKAIDAILPIVKKYNLTISCNSIESFEVRINHVEIPCEGFTKTKYPSKKFSYLQLSKLLADKNFAQFCVDTKVERKTSYELKFIPIKQKTSNVLINGLNKIFELMTLQPLHYNLYKNDWDCFVHFGENPINKYLQTDLDFTEVKFSSKLDPTPTDNTVGMQLSFYKRIPNCDIYQDGIDVIFA